MRGPQDTPSCAAKDFKATQEAHTGGELPWGPHGGHLLQNLGIILWGGLATGRTTVVKTLASGVC